MKRATLIAITAVLALVLAGALPATARAQDNAAVAVNTKDGSSIFKLAFKIVRVNRDVVDNVNAAFAFASCAECTTVAVAFQAVLIFSDPDEVTTTNLAWAENYLCDECLTFAYAYQKAFTTGGPVHFTAEANQQLAEIRRALQEIRNDIENIDSWPTPPECEGINPDLLNACKLEARLAPLKEQFAQVLMTGLVPAGPPPAENEAPAEEQTQTEPTQPETTETTTEPTETETTTETTTTTTP
jgi:putative peptide zinc metalloprotease protein